MLDYKHSVHDNTPIYTCSSAYCQLAFKISSDRPKHMFFLSKGILYWIPWINLRDALIRVQYLHLNPLYYTLLNPCILW